MLHWLKFEFTFLMFFFSFFFFTSLDSLWSHSSVIHDPKQTFSHDQLQSSCLLFVIYAFC